MPKKHLLLNPYRPGDENRLGFYDRRLLRFLAAHLGWLEKYFRYEVSGLENIPKDAPALLVLNHGLIPFDELLLAKRIFERYGRRLRVLAHSRSWHLPIFREIALNLGVVDANPKNAVDLLKKGELVCVFPGGAREGCKSSSLRYHLPWADRYGFAKVAVAAGVPVIPCMSVGIDDVYHVLGLFSRLLPFPLFFGLGLLPLPRKVTHYIGEPIHHRKVLSLHHQVWRASRRLLSRGLEERRRAVSARLVRLVPLTAARKFLTRTITKGSHHADGHV